MISKELILQGSETWTLISKKNGCVFWSDAAPEINRKFMSIARSPSRGLSTQVVFGFCVLFIYLSIIFCNFFFASELFFFF